MMQSAIAIFDVGKTNKKLFLFNEHYKIVYEQAEQFNEIKDGDGFPCEDIEKISAWIKNVLKELLAKKEFDLKAINFSAYGASFVHINKTGNTVAPLYNYLKPFPEDLKNTFYHNYGGEIAFSKTTASPVLGNLNSGMQLYWLKNMQPEIFSKIEYSLHLPQYLSYLITQNAFSDITSIGCHTNLWNFSKNAYHHWVSAEKINEKLAPIFSCSKILEATFLAKNLKVGIGLHDSSAALIPYLSCFSEPFILISTGTWCISLNPFNNQPLTEEELKQDCLCYLSYQGKPVKASRLFAGNEHEIETKRLAKYFNTSSDFFKKVDYDESIISQLLNHNKVSSSKIFSERNLDEFVDYQTAYHQLILDIIEQQKASTHLVLQDKNMKRIFVDGGFSKNSIYMHLLAKAFPNLEIFAASVAQATAVGAALAIHKHWNTKPLPTDIIDLKFYAKPQV